MAPMFEVFALSLNYFVKSQEGGMVSILISQELISASSECLCSQN